MKEDSYEDIQKCLRCKFPTCVNCLSESNQISAKTRTRLDRVQELWDLGMTDRAIASSMKLSPTHVARLRRMIGLPAHLRSAYERAEAI